ncbi:54S ribosomal protein, mitochondrial [Ascosphaera aggregata]|nr:54S ribosomal protein, mitochondrial [Ascosphaera aggregata]
MSGIRVFGAVKWLRRSSTGVLGSFDSSLNGIPKAAAMRSMATEADLPQASTTSDESLPLPEWHSAPVIATLYRFQNMEPLRFVEYQKEQLGLPLRRDILHKAIVYEGNKTRQGTASTKWRDDVHGSGRKIRPQKGTGRARLGDKKSPMLRGGGVAFGPHPRDFSTQLLSKLYDKAWRTALSYRLKRDQLHIVDKITFSKDQSPMRLKYMLDEHRWGKKFGRSLLITDVKRERVMRAASEFPGNIRALDVDDVDVKDLLETGRLIIEKPALDRILKMHSRDINQKVPSAFDFDERLQ